MASQYDTLSYAEAKQLLSTLNKVPRHMPGLKVLRQFLEGEHWQGQDAWIGPKANPEVEGSTELMTEVRRSFTSANKIDEVNSRHVFAVAGHPVAWQWAPQRFMKKGETPTDTEETDIAFLEGLSTRHWDKRNAQDLLRRYLYAVCAFGHAVMRYVLPAGKLTTDASGTTTVEVTDEEEAIDLAYIELPDPENAGIYEDPRTKEPLAIVVVKRDDGTDVVELTYFDGDLTVYRGLTMGNLGSEYRVAIDLGKQLNCYEGRRKPLITNNVLQNQRALNLALSMIPRNVITGGFLERTYLNAQMPGKWTLNAAGERVEFVPTTFALGPASTAWVRGLEVTKADGTTDYTNPVLDRGEPIDPKAAIAATTFHERMILSEVSQEHVLTNTEAIMSGKSREQARAGFLTSLLPTKTIAEQAVAFLVTLPIALMEYLTNQPGKWTSVYRVVAQARLDAGPVGPDEREQDLAAMKEGGLSMEMLMERSGIVDVDAEMARVQADPMYKLRVQERQFEVLAKAKEADIDPTVAAKYIGMPADFISDIEKKQQEARDQAMAEIEAKPQPTLKPAGGNGAKPAPAPTR